MNLEYINQLLQKKGIIWESCGYEDVDIKFDVTPHDYLAFMEADLNGLDRRNLINALSNGKRALDCQIEALLYGFCLKAYTDKKKLGIPDKIELLNRLGIIAPRILRKINKLRNMMEHDFYCPGEEEVQDFADVILLFISYTDKYLYDVKSDCEIVDDSHDFYCIPEFGRENQEILINVRRSDQGTGVVKAVADGNTIELLIDFLKLYIKLTS